MRRNSWVATRRINSLETIVYKPYYQRRRGCRRNRQGQNRDRERPRQIRRSHRRLHLRGDRYLAAGDDNSVIGKQVLFCTHIESFRMQPRVQFNTGVDAGRNDAVLKRAEPGRPGRLPPLAALLLAAFAAIPTPSSPGADRRHLRAHGCGAEHDPWQNLRRHRLRQCHRDPSRRHQPGGSSPRKHDRPCGGGFRRADLADAAVYIPKHTDHSSRRGVRRSDLADVPATGRRLADRSSPPGCSTI